MTHTCKPARPCLACQSHRRRKVQDRHNELRRWKALRFVKLVKPVAEPVDVDELTANAFEAMQKRA
jgi:hypothetical protein